MPFNDKENPTNTVMYFRRLDPNLVRAFKTQCALRDLTHKQAFENFMKAMQRGAFIDDNGTVISKGD